MAQEPHYKGLLGSGGVQAYNAIDTEAAVHAQKQWVSFGIFVPVAGSTLQRGAVDEPKEPCQYSIDEEILAGGAGAVCAIDDAGLGSGIYGTCTQSGRFQPYEKAWGGRRSTSSAGWLDVLDVSTRIHVAISQRTIRLHAKAGAMEQTPGGDVEIPSEVGVEKNG